MSIKQKKIRVLILKISFFLGICFTILSVEASFAVSVKPILPKNQSDTGVTYYDLRMNPGQEQELKLEVSNPSDIEQEITIELNDATTNLSGEIDYSDRSGQVSRDKSLVVSFKDIAQVESKAIVPAHEKRIIIVQLKMPPEQFDGMILGGIKISSIDSSQSQLNDQSRKKSYIVAVKLTETDAPVMANLNLLRVLPKKVDGRQTIQATVQNDQAINVEELEYTATITEEGSDQVLYQVAQSNYRMAPNSSTTFIIADENDALTSAGRYSLQLTVKSKDTGQEWKWNKGFELVKETENYQKNSKHLMIYIVICSITLAFLLIVLIALILLRRRRQRQYEAELYQKKKKRKRRKKSQQNKKRNPENKQQKIKKNKRR
ncbi:DUF916 and DUF3324 domain-containing protein [Enterococcus sp. DIV0242_7C1]|uniref:Uncharacterized protein n=1 Tax=Candidatus Enterococcus dunnyi TaxID=1834192 RepID=A0A200IYZ6_9ENTE|nr:MULTISPECIES: DUF916 and DUF3324 domain-containing protein [unclassified Enterococcus]MBO0470444.1 DUF916 and DUF3324 domain-containing protein [Enterococcus sp. DIV0242_7C1]OUZ30192.1 hypothetical protein A5889_002480 [Enterococcus sp. 9D6_DIV0238]